MPNHSEIKSRPSFEITSKLTSTIDSNDSKNKNSRDLTSSHAISECLEEHQITSFKSKQGNHEPCYFDIDRHFSYQLIEDESDIYHHFCYQLLEDDPETSSKELNESETSSEEHSSNHEVNYNPEDLRINYSHLEKSINMPISFSIAENISSSSFNPYSKTFNLY